MTQAPPRETRVLRRSGEGRILAGVCAGLGRYTGIDPVVFRVGFAVLLFGSGIGFFLYIAGFLLMKDPRGNPGIIEQWTRRDFDAEAVLALMTAVLAFGLGINLATVWLGTGTLVVGMLLVIALLAAHANGVDLLALARSMPERLNRRQTSTPQPPPPVTPSPSFPYERQTRTVVNETIHDRPAPPYREPTAGEAPRYPRGEAAPGEPTSHPAAPHTEAASPAEAAPHTGEAPRGDATSPAEAASAADATSPEKTAFPAEAVSRADEARRGDAPTRVAPTPYGELPEPAPRPAPTRQERSPRTAEQRSYGEPFAPHGPYQPLDPHKRAGYSPYDPALYGEPILPPAQKRRPRSYIGAITVLLALIIGGILVAVQARSAAGVNPTAVGAAVLITIGAGLLVAAWWGRGAGLVALGTTVALIIAAGLMLGGLPKKVGEFEWTPTSVAEAGQNYDVGVGDGRLDLSELQMEPGSKTTFNASVSLGELTVIVPPSARVEVHATAKVGDITIDQSLRGGVDVEFDKVLAPESAPKGAVSTIVLNLKGGVGDVEVRRAA